MKMEELLAKYFSREATNDEINLVETWRSESETNANAFLDAKKIWLETQPEITPPLSLLEGILNQPKAKQVPFILKNWVKYASAAVLILAISLLFVLNDDGMEDGFSIQNLSDGSVVALHGESSLEIISFDDISREVSVTGKAYFDIERDETRPFVIHTEHAKVAVLGTSFVVDTYGPKTEVSVESGLVELSKIIGTEDVVVKLSEGEMGLVSSTNTGILKMENDDANYLAWKTKVITFNQSYMSEVKEVLEDVYGIEVSFENPSFKNCKLTAKFNKKKIKDALEIIARTFDIEYDYSKKKAVLKGKGC